MKKILLVIVLLIIVFALLPFLSSTPQKENEVAVQQEKPVQVIPISHATALLQWENAVIYMDPTGEAEAFQGKPAANIIVVTDIHGDHLSTSTLRAVIASSTLIVPQAVKDLLPQDLATLAQIMKNGDTLSIQGFQITAIPMYNLPEAADSRHTKGRGNGYVIEKDGFRVYIAGDTSGIPEMRALSDIDIAFVPMNLPYTMSVEEAADAVLAFKPRTVYPYHYRGQDGLSDVNKFKELVHTGDSSIEVILANWYPEM